jgi:UrcA family protein
LRVFEPLTLSDNLVQSRQTGATNWSYPVITPIEALPTEGRTQMNTIALKALAAASLSLLAVAPAAAQEVRVTVHHGDLDIATPAGAAILAERLEVGAKAACGRIDPRDMKAGAALSSCREAAMQNAVEQATAKGAAIDGATLASL